MKKKNRKALDIIIKYYEATEHLIDIQEEIGSKSGIFRLFDIHRSLSSENAATDLPKVICLKAWKKRNNLVD